jgi:DNA-binding MarR family transcriptional regulator
MLTSLGQQCDSNRLMKTNVFRSPSVQPVIRGVEAWLKVVEAYSLCDRMLTERLGQTGVPIAEHDLLMALLRNSGATQQQIAKGCFVAKSGVSMLLTKMQGKGLVRREADKVDARIKRVFLTAKGEKLAAKTLQIQLEVVEIMAKPLTDADLKQVTQTMQSVIASLKTKAGSN